MQYFCYLSHTPVHPEDDNCQAEVRNVQQNYYSTLQLSDYKKAKEMDDNNAGACAPISDHKYDSFCHAYESL